MKTIVKSILKRILPLKLRRRLRRIQAQIFGMEASYRGLKTEDVFDKIYKEGVWGRDENGESTSGSGSHTEDVIRPYILAVSNILERYQQPTMVDLGCGDFNVGRNFVEKSSSYIACDISEYILNRNKEKFNFTNVSFRKLNLAEDSLPFGDIAFIRQVLQHLGNEEIISFVKKLNDRRPYKCLVVTESLPIAKNFTPNLNKPSGSTIRVVIDSGVVLEESPFNLQFQSKEIVLEVPESAGGFELVIRTTLYTL